MRTTRTVTTSKPEGERGDSNKNEQITKNDVKIIVKP